MIFATSCENDLDLGAAGETSLVSFTVDAPQMSRAYSDGTTATVLQYAVYDAAGNLLPTLTVTDAEIHGSTTVTVQLTTGNSYSIVFWAAAEDAPYTVDFANKTMTVDYANAKSNDEKRDAFYKRHDFTVSGTQNETIELKRPFAQLNIGTSDYTASANAGYTPTKSSVTVRNIYNKLNLFDGTVENPAEVTFDYNDIPTTETFPVNGYEYISMNYLLVHASKTVVDIDFSYTDAADNAKTRTVGSVPVQRNYRTNLFGQLLTSEVSFNVAINPDYDDADYNVNLPNQ